MSLLSLTAVPLKILCDECGWIGITTDMLTAKNPFNAKQTIDGCPNCREVNTLMLCCDEPNCSWSVCVTSETATGTRRTCEEHRPR